jgi:hypothetical protein
MTKPVVVADQHPARVAERGGNAAAQVIADQVLVPLRRGEQPLRSVRFGLARVLGQRPCGLPLQPDKSPFRHERARTRTSRRPNLPATSANMSSSPVSSRDPSISSTLASTATLGCPVHARLNLHSGGRPISGRFTPANIASHRAMLVKCKGGGFENRRDYVVIALFKDTGIRLFWSYI